MEPVATSTVTLDEEFVEVALMFARHVEEDGYHADGLFDSVTADMIQMLHLEKQRGYPPDCFAVKQRDYVIIFPVLR